MTQNKLILLLSRNISHTAGEKGDVVSKRYPSGKQYVAFPETKEGQKDLDKFARRMDGVGSWKMAKNSALLLIKTSVIKDQKLRIKGNSAISTVAFKSCF